jgi:moderate conductance mechanosensitive channel
VFDWIPDDWDWAVTVGRIVLLVLGALIARYVLRRLIRRTVRRASQRSPHYRFKPAQALVQATTIPNERREQRIAALGSIGNSVVSATIFVVLGLMILAELGFNITTIVAGTSIIAVTVAFGAQSIVKDLISGVFMLVEDQLGVGDWVDMDKASGEVREIGLRITQLRAEDGTLWYVRNGEVLRVGNFSQGGPNQLPEPAPAE